jgi:hypothetical protein
MMVQENIWTMLAGAVLSGGVMLKVVEHFLDKRKTKSDLKQTDTNTDSLLIENFKKMSETYLMMNDTLQTAIIQEKKHTEFCERELKKANDRIDNMLKEINKIKNL